MRAKVKNIVFCQVGHEVYRFFPEYAQYFGRSLILLKSMYGMNNSGKLFSDELIEWLLEAVFIQSQCHMPIYYKYAPYGSKIDVLSYVAYLY